MDRARIAVAVALVAAAAVVAAVLAGGDDPAPDGAFPTTATAPPTPLPAQCLDAPSPIEAPEWFPDDLAVPDGSYPSSLLPPQPGLRRVVFTVDASLSDFVTFLLEAWPDAGWNVGRGESEPGEAESSFSRGDTFGAFRARAVYCDKTITEVLFVLNDPSFTPEPAP